MPRTISAPVIFAQLALDPLQITDIRVQPLLGGSTSLAVLSYQLTEPATVYIDIYPPGTIFCSDSSGNPALNDVNNIVTDNPALVPAKNFQASSGLCIAGAGAASPVGAAAHDRAAANLPYSRCFPSGTAPT